MADIKIRLTVSTPRVGSHHSVDVKFDAEEWAEASESERDEMAFQALVDSGALSWDWEEVEHG